MRCAAARLALALSAAAPLWGAAHTFPAPNRIRYDARCLAIEGETVFISCTPFGPATVGPSPGRETARAPVPVGSSRAAIDFDRWRRRFRAIKAGGFNAVAAPELEPVALADWLNLAHSEFGFYTLLAVGGPDAVAQIRAVAPQQVTRRRPGSGGVILVQLPSGEAGRNGLRRCAALGIDLPLFAAGAPHWRDSDDPELGAIFDSLRWRPALSFEARIGELSALESAQPDAPELVAQEQSPPSAALELAQALTAIQQGATILNFSWPNPAAAEPVRLNRMLSRAGADLAESHPLTIQVQTGSPDVTLVVRRSRGGATYLFLCNRSASSPRRGRASLWLDRDGVEIGVDFMLPPLAAQVMRLPANSTDTSRVEQLLGQ